MGNCIRTCKEICEREDPTIDNIFHEDLDIEFQMALGDVGIGQYPIYTIYDVDFPFLSKLLEAQKIVVDKWLKGKLEEQIDAEDFHENPQMKDQHMQALMDSAWTWQVRSRDDQGKTFYEPLDVFECININHRIEQRERGVADDPDEGDPDLLSFKYFEVDLKTNSAKPTAQFYEDTEKVIMSRNLDENLEIIRSPNNERRRNMRTTQRGNGELMMVGGPKYDHLTTNDTNAGVTTSTRDIDKALLETQLQGVEPPQENAVEATAEVDKDQEDVNEKQGTHGGAFFEGLVKDFGKMWRDKNHGQFTPSMKQIVDGIALWVVDELDNFGVQVHQSEILGIPKESLLPHEQEEVDELLANRTIEQKMKIRPYKKVFKKLQEVIQEAEQINKKQQGCCCNPELLDYDQPIPFRQYEIQGEFQTLPGGLADPNNFYVKTIIWLYTIEPPIYASLNKACRERDESKIDSLGPFARALYFILGNAEMRRKDQMNPGIDLHSEANPDELGPHTQSFLVFRGALMHPDWIEPYKKQVGKKGMQNPDEEDATIMYPEKPAFINMQGSLSTSARPEIALNFAQRDDKYPNRIPVLFVINIQNYRNYAGFRLNKYEYSAYATECEILFAEGLLLFVMAVEEVEEVNNSKFVSKEALEKKYPDPRASDEARNAWQHHDTWKSYQGKPLTIIHLCNTN